MVLGQGILTEENQSKPLGIKEVFKRTLFFIVSALFSMPFVWELFDPQTTESVFRVVVVSLLAGGLELYAWLGMRRHINQKRA